VLASQVWSRFYLARRPVWQVGKARQLDKTREGSRIWHSGDHKHGGTRVGIPGTVHSEAKVAETLGASDAGGSVGVPWRRDGFYRLRAEEPLAPAAQTCVELAWDYQDLLLGLHG
jgi:hypothetical protein